MSPGGRSHDDIDSRLDSLEARLDEQAEIIDQQREHLDEQAEIIDQQRERIAELDGDDDGDVIMNRRTALQAGGILGLLGVGAGAASADPQGSVGTGSDPLQNLHAATVNADTLTDDGSGDVTVGTELDLDGNDVRLTEDYELDMQPGLDTVEFRDTNNSHTTLRIGTGDPGIVSLMNANLRIRNGYGVTDGFGETHLTINGTGPLGVNKTLDLNGNAIDNAVSINGALTGNTEITDLVGSGLSINSGSLEASGSNSWSDGDSNGLLEPSGTETGIEVTDVNTDNLTDNGSGTVSMGSTLDLDGNDLDSRSVGSDFSVNIDSNASNGDEQFVVQTNDIQNSTPTIDWRRMASAGVALRVFDVTNDTDLLSVNDSGEVDIHNDNLDLNSNEITNVSDLTATTINVDNLTVNTSGSVTMGTALNLNSNNVTNVGELTATTVSAASIDNDGSAIGVGDALNLSASDSIQDSGTDAIQFDGSQNVTLGNGNLDVQGGSLGGATVENSSGSLTLSTGGSLESINLNPSGDVRLSSDLFLGGNKIYTFTESGDLVLEAETDNNASPDTGKILLNGVESDSSDTANIELNPGSNNGDVQVTNGTLDVQTGTVRNTTGALTVSTDSGDLQLSPSGNVMLSSANLDLNGNTLTTSTGAIRLTTATPSSDPIKQSVPDTGNVGAGALNNSELAFALDETNTELDAYMQDSSGTSGQIAAIGSYSTERLKSDIQPYAGDPERVLDIQATTFTLGNGDGDERLGITAESAHDAGLEWLVEYKTVEDAWQTDEGISEEYLEKYAIERDGETVVPDNIHDRAWLAMHHELLRDLSKENDQKAERIEELEAENDRLRDRLDAIEAHLGMDGSTAQVVADD